MNAWPDGYCTPTYSRPHVCGWGETHKRLERMKAAARDLWNHTVTGGLVIDETLLPQRAIDEVGVMMTEHVRTGRHGRDDWKRQTIKYHLEHLRDHLDKFESGKPSDEPDLTNLTARALFALALHLTVDLPGFANETDHVAVNPAIFDDEP
jgi:hypothetical protein